MKNVLFFTLEMQGLQEASQIQAACEHIEAGDNVLYVTCGRSLGFCNDNRKGNHLQCRFCKKRQLARSKKAIKGLNSIHSIDEYTTPDDWQQANRQQFTFDTLDELKRITYEDIEIGYGALSSYVSYTRNIDAKADEIRDYVEDLMRMQIRMILTFKRIISSFQPQLMVFHNGRFAEYKPLLGLARKFSIDYLCTENLLVSNGTRCQDNYFNGTPHNVMSRYKNIISTWEANDDHEDRERTGRQFFENRRNARFAGDTIYAKDQKLGKLPQNWDVKKENIVIFNSSEDEFFAIGSEAENTTLFKSQLDGIRTLLEHYLSDENKHFTLRIHPHLKGLPYPYHQDLYRLKYANLTIIPPESDVSTYALIDACCKVVVFGSTTGVEACYWHKPVINLGYAFYAGFDVAYVPKTKDELWHFIDTKDLQPKDSQNALPIGYYFMTDKRPQLNYAKAYEHREMRSLFGNRYIWHQGYSLLDSEYLYGIWRALMYRFEGRIPGLTKYKQVPAYYKS